MTRREPGDGFWGGVLSKWLAGIAVPAAIGLAYLIQRAIVAEMRVQDTVPKLEMTVQEHEEKIRAFQAQAIPPGMTKRLDDFLTDQERKKARQQP